MARHCVVLRKFGGPEGKEFRVGELVDVETWMHADRLIATRHLRPATVEEISNAVEIDDDDGNPPPKFRKRKHAA